MAEILLLILCWLIGYVLGAFPTGYFAGRMWGVDVRKHGSGRTGGTNVLRSAGWGAFGITVLGDIFKGFLAVVITRVLFPDFPAGHAITVYGVCIGHNWSVWIALLTKPDPNAQYAAPPLGWIQRIATRGRGGAGVATTGGAALALFAPAVGIILPIGLLVLLISRYASLASITGASLMPVVMLAFTLAGYTPWSYVVLGLALGVTIILVHRPNIDRLRAGTEKKFGQRLAQREMHPPKPLKS
jgi:acyl phosphate:glycerol-3-phosphate acyltransferase